jgi:hypothetical protein
VRTCGVLYLSDRGLKNFGPTLKEVQDMGADYHTKFFNQEDAGYYVPKLMSVIKNNNNDEIISNFQQVRGAEDRSWEWYLTTIKVLMRDLEGQALLTISMAFTMVCPPTEHFSVL